MQNQTPEKVVTARYLYPFILVTSLFALWGFANDVTNPLVRAFKEIFLIGFYVLTFGLAFLETSANPYILSMGSPETATRRLNLAQAFNPMGSLTGMAVASFFILPSLQVAEFREAQWNAHPEYADMMPSEVDGLINTALETFRDNRPEEHMAMVAHDLNVVKIPYVIIALVVITVLALFIVSKMPDKGDEEEEIKLVPLLKHLLFNFHYLGGVLAQTFYVGAQIMCWTFIIHYGMTLIGLSAAQAQNYNILAMGIFLGSRFICTFFLKYINPGLLLGILAIGGGLLTTGAIFIQGMPGLYCLIGVSACMSLMFPTIYGIALEDLTPNDAKLGSAGLIFAIVGGAFMPRIQGAIIDGEGMTLFGQTLESVRVSFFLPVICFVVIAVYGFLSNVFERRAHPAGNR